MNSYGLLLSPQKRPTFVPIQDKMNPVQQLPDQQFKNYFNVIPPSPASWLILQKLIVVQIS